MKIRIEATDKITHLDGVQVRIWDGVTERGIKCLVFVHRIAVHNDADPGQFEEELEEKMPPGRLISLRNIL